MLGGKNLDWVRCYAEGKYTYVQEGRPVWSEYDDSTMSDDLMVDENIPVQVGLDFGLTPSAVFGQRMPSGAWHILHFDRDWETSYSDQTGLPSWT